MPRNFIDEILDDVPKYTLRNSEGDVLNDNVDIALKTPVIQEGTPLNKKFFDELFTYEELGYEKIDHSYDEEYTQRLTFALPTFADNSNDIEGTGNSNLYNGSSSASTTPTVTMHTNAANGFKLSDGSGSASIVTVSANSSERTDISYINEVLARTSYSSSYYITLRGAVYKSFKFDLKAPKRVTFKVRYTTTYMGDSTYFSGSNDGVSWTSIATIGEADENTDVSIDSVDAYRYYMFGISATAGGQDIYYMYLEVNDTRKILSYENLLTTQSELTANKEIIVRVPSTLDTTNVTTNTLNGIEIENMLAAGQRYRLVYDGEKLIDSGHNVVTGNFSSTTELQTIGLGFTPDLVICYHYNNNYNYIGAFDSDNASGWDVPRILTKALLRPEHGQIVEDGFTYSVVDVSTVNSDNNIIYYIAIKF